MTTTMKFMLAALCAGALMAPAAMAQTTTGSAAPAAQTAPATAAAAAPAATGAKEFIPSTPNLPKPGVQPRSGGGGLTKIPEPGSLPLVALAIVAAVAVLRRKK